MARIARVVLPGHPHHLTQRGNNRQQTFFDAHDYEAYLRFAADEFRAAEVEVLAYCLMPNHVHLVVVPASEGGLGQAVGQTHLRYTRRLNARMSTSGHIWQGRFHSFAMDEGHLLSCVRYVALNPVRAGLAQRAIDWRWSSARAHLLGWPDPLVSRRSRERFGAMAQLFEHDLNAAALELFRDASLSGLPVGSDEWVNLLEAARGRRLRAGKVGRPRRQEMGDTYEFPTR